MLLHLQISEKEGCLKACQKPLSLEMLQQIGETVEFIYTNWTQPDDPLTMARSLTEAIGDANFNCPISALADKLSRNNIVVYR